MAELLGCRQGRQRLGVVWWHHGGSGAAGRREGDDQEPMAWALQTPSWPGRVSLFTSTTFLELVVVVQHRARGFIGASLRVAAWRHGIYGPNLGLSWLQGLVCPY
jgi:hypothetical protein